MNRLKRSGDVSLDWIGRVETERLDTTICRQICNMKGEFEEEPVVHKYQQVSDEEETKVDNGKKEGEEEED